jgi:flavin reductase (DIM6/NTAB) family NADH-FMN oxidoreductase RutF
MTKQLWRGGALIAPMPPVMVSCGTMENPNIITIAWTGITNTIPPKTYISVRPKRYSYPIIKESGGFVINLATAEMVRAVDYCGIYTGAKVNKFEKCGLTP